ncbi:MAG TPA: nicotinate-nucleotide--dimethylbenzimidazole phosphoribosyltransferase [Polyangia bacterium]|nr:nicotinate-nucleotide--dimethylbenzimidazole phosphoribosyltransferase [Polyangia bacterium]
MSELISKTIAAIEPPDERAAEAAQKWNDAKTKPPGALGRLEELARRLAAARGLALPQLARKVVVVMAADHGVTVEGVSAYPAEVTPQMVHNFVRGGAAINVLARLAGAKVMVVDMGVRGTHDFGPGVVSMKIGDGTANLAVGPAMTREQAERSIEAGIALAVALGEQGVDLVGTGDMGIGNTTASSAIVAALCKVAPSEVTGRGTGIDDATLQRKVRVIERALAVNRPDPADPIDVLAKLGGFEIGGLCGLMLGAASLRVPTLVDGHISGAAALLAARLAPLARGYLFASHRSVEVGHGRALAELGPPPLLDLGMRLGEGTGAALAMLLCEAALRVQTEMASFAEAGVSGKKE